MTPHTPPNPIHAGWRELCPRCGMAPLYGSYLKPMAHCPVCLLDYSRADAGDGAVPFVTLITGALGALVGWFGMFVLGMPMLWVIIIASLFAIAVTFYLLPKTKSLLIAMQYHYKAGDDTSLRFKDSD